MTYGLTSYYCLYTSLYFGDDCMIEFCDDYMIVFWWFKMMSEEESRKMVNIQRQTGFLGWCINTSTSLLH